MYEQNSYTIIHEIGHALGLGHPGGDGKSSFTDANETVMSYNYKQTNKPWTFSYADLETLKLIWGEEDDIISSSRRENNGSNYSGIAVSKNERQNQNSIFESTDVSYMRFNREQQEKGFVDKITGDFIHYGSNDFERQLNEDKKNFFESEVFVEEYEFSKNNISQKNEYQKFIDDIQLQEEFDKLFAIPGFQEDFTCSEYKTCNEFFGFDALNFAEIF